MTTSKVVVLSDDEIHYALAFGLNAVNGYCASARQKLAAALQQEGQEGVEYRAVGQGASGRERVTNSYCAGPFFDSRVADLRREGVTNIRIQSRTVTQTPWVDLDPSTSEGS